VWDCFAKIYPLLRSTRLLEITERADLITYITNFGELLAKNTTKNPTPRMHPLFCTVGLFSEYSLEVIHAFPVFGWGSPDKTGTSFFVGRE
jgi:hypothetical protein